MENISKPRNRREEKGVKTGLLKVLGSAIKPVQ